MRSHKAVASRGTSASSKSGVFGVVRTFAGLMCLSALLLSSAVAQEEVEADVPADVPAAESDALPLHVLEQALLQDFERFEEKLLELAEYTRRNDPDRADLLVRTRSESTSRRVQAQMERIAEALAPTESGDVLYGDALARQEELISDLAELLKLLQSEDERDRLDREIARLKDLVKDVERVIGQQKDVRADTERGGDPSKLSGDQQDVNESADALADKIDQQDAQRKAEADRQSGSQEQGDPQEGDPKEGQPTDGKSPDGKPKEGDPSEGEPKDPAEDPESPDGKTPDDQKDAKPSDPGEKPSESGMPPDGESRDGKPSDGKPSDGKPSESKPSEGDMPPSEGEQQSQEGQPSEGQQSPPQQDQQSQQGQQSQQTPGREQLEEAREKMEQAIKELELKRLDKASDEQDAALAKLEEMKAELEEILRQLREEEKKLFLMALEARFQRMLEKQLDINNETLKLDRVAVEERDEDRHLAQSTKLSRDEADNATDAEKALVLLYEDGSSVAFPEAVEMMRENMQAVVGRLQRGQTAETTQLLERMIVESLEEIIFALQKEMEKQDQQQQQQQQQQAQQQGDPSLVDTLAELKMIRSLQSQVNRLTRQYGLEIDGEQATNPEDLTFLRNLAGRQRRIQDATYDLSIGKNK